MISDYNDYLQKSTAFVWCCRWLSKWLLTILITLWFVVTSGFHVIIISFLTRHLCLQPIAGHVMSIYQIAVVTSGISLTSELFIPGSIFTVLNERLQDFTVLVSNRSNIDDQADICAYHPGYIQDGGRALLPCDGIKVARYLSVINSQVHENYDWFFLCEVVVIGAVAAGKRNIHTLAISEFDLILILFVHYCEVRFLQITYARTFNFHNSNVNEWHMAKI